MTGSASARPSPDDPQAERRPAVRGFVLNSDLRALREWLPGRVDDLLARLAPADRAVCRASKPTAWVPLDLSARLLELAAEALALDSGEAAERLGAALADNQLASLLGAAVRTRSSDLLTANAGYLWISLYTPGELRIVLDHPGHRAFEVRGDAPHGDTVCRRNLGFGRRALALTGAIDVRLEHPRCRSRGDEFCSYDVRWRETKG